MPYRSVTALILAFWLTALGLVGSAMQFAEQLHQLGIDNQHSSASSEQHQQGRCLTGELSKLTASMLSGYAVPMLATPKVDVQHQVPVLEQGFASTKIALIRGPPTV